MVTPNLERFENTNKLIPTNTYIAINKKVYSFFIKL